MAPIISVDRLEAGLGQVQQVPRVQAHRQPPKAEPTARPGQPRPGQVWRQAQLLQATQRALLPVSAVELKPRSVNSGGGSGCAGSLRWRADSRR